MTSFPKKLHDGEKLKFSKLRSRSWNLYSNN